MEADVLREGLVGTAVGGDDTALPVVPSPRARRILLFEFAILVEYWIAPLLFGLTNYAGTWSDVGIGLFLMFVTSLVLLVLLPLRPHLTRALSTRRPKLLFHAVWSVAFVAGLFLTNTFQLGVVGTASRSVELGSTTVYTPFGAWSSLTVFVPSWRFFGTFDFEILTVLLLVSILGASAVTISSSRRAPACPAPARDETPWKRTLSRLAIWSPLGLITGCASCAPLYLAGVGLLVPSVAVTGFAAEPLVPWIGLAGLLYLASFGLAVHLIRGATGSDPPPTSEP